MNNVAAVSQSCREARSSDSLDQRHTGTIVLCKGATTTTSICNAIVRGKWNTFASNRTSVKIENVDNVIGWFDIPFASAEANLVSLDGVDSLTLTGQIFDCRPISRYLRFESIQVVVGEMRNMADQQTAGRIESFYQ